MDFGVWLALIGLFFAGGLTPGPAVLLVMSSSLRYGFRLALLPALGVSFANLIWIGAAISGAGALAVRYPTVFFALKLLGLSFILWLALRIALSDPGRKLASAEDAPRRSLLFARGVGLQFANPNALVFFGLLLPAYIDADRQLLTQALIIVMTVTTTEMLGLGLYAWAADAMNKRLSSRAFAVWFNRCAALAMFLMAGFAVVMTSVSP